MEKINFKITTPEKVVYKANVDSITLPTKEGEITILPKHIPLISILKPGEIKVVSGNEVDFISVSGGFIEVLSTKVVILADTAERSEEIDVSRAEVAMQRAKELRDQRRVDAKEFVMLSAQIEKELARIRVGKKGLAKRADRQAVDIKKYEDGKYN
jgi:F-type H+-transporting ATPase subunit epsilon